jgi:hypothetical protein
MYRRGRLRDPMMVVVILVLMLMLVVHNAVVITNRDANILGPNGNNRILEYYPFQDMLSI